MVKQIIPAITQDTLFGPQYKRTPNNDGTPVLHIAEHFMDTVQGENFSGYPAAFLRMQGCTLNCVWCDTTEVWRRGNPYTVKEVIDLWKQSGLYDKLQEGQHLVLTGGSPVKQQKGLVALLDAYVSETGVKPFVEIENECTLMPTEELIKYVDVWNNSPKLANSEMRVNSRYKPQILKRLGELPNSYFKFVVSSEADWQEINRDFIAPGYVRKNQIVLMPEGQTRTELQAHYDIVVNLAVRENVRMCDRLHVTVWDKKTGV